MAAGGGTMKKAVIFLLLLTPMALVAQQAASDATLATPDGTVLTSVNFPTERLVTPTMADLYCAGFVSKPIQTKHQYVAGGLESPFTTRFASGEAIFLNGKYETGQRYTIVRETLDSDRYELFPGQWSALKAAGQPYEELARVQVIDTRGKMAVAKIEFSCDSVLPGDYVVPFVEKPEGTFHAPMRFDRFAPSTGQLSGRIILAKDFDSELGTGGKVYLNVGANQGLKLGDFVRATRSYETTARDAVDSLSFIAKTQDPTQTKGLALNPSFLDRTSGPIARTSEMPRRAVGEILIIGVNPGTATGMIVFAMEPVHIGDRVELDRQ
jgi:hypothetical protein